MIIKQLATEHDVRVGETCPNIHCPFCKANEKSLSITRTEQGILYNCFRAKCRAHGFVSLHPGSLLTEHKEKEFAPKKFNYPLRNFSDEELSEYFGKYELPIDLLRDNGFRYDYTNGRVAMPIFNSAFLQVGWVAKTLPNTVWKGPKAVSYWENDSPKIHFPKGDDLIPHCVAIVEGTYDAVKVAQFIECVALLGVNLMPRAAAELARFYDRVLVILDPGAEDAALHIIRKYKLYFQDMKMLILQQDPKDTPTEELKRAIYGTISPWLDAIEAGSV